MNEVSQNTIALGTVRVTYEYTGRPENVKAIAMAVNQLLKGNNDYILGNIECHYRHVYISITVFPIVTGKLPEFLSSNGNWIRFINETLKGDNNNE